MTNKKRYPLELLRSSSALFADIRLFVTNNNDVICIAKDDGDLEIHLNDKLEGSKFEFKVYNPSYKEKRTFFKYLIMPKDTHSIDSLQSFSNDKGVLLKLKEWTAIIRSYNNINLSPYDISMAKYEEEFSQVFYMVEDDADVSPFNLERQIIIYNYLSATIKLLEDQIENEDDLIKDAERIRNNIGSMTKNQTVGEISRLYAKVRIKSFTLFKEFLEVAKKELLKKVFVNGSEFVTGHLTSWLQG